MDKVLNSEQFKARRNSFFQKKLNSLQERKSSNLKDIADVVCRTYSVKKGAYLYREGERCNTVYVVRSGSVKTTRQNAAGMKQVVGFYLAGDMVGFDGFATGNYTCTSKILETSSVSELPMDILDKHSRITPGVQQKILSSMSNEIQRDHELLLVLGRMNTEERLAAFLLNFSSRMKQRHRKETEFYLSMARYDIANYLGFAVETASRIFAQFRERGLIDIDKRHVKIIDMEKLKRIIDGSAETTETGGSHVYRTSTGAGA